MVRLLRNILAALVLFAPPAAAQQLSGGCVTVGTTQICLGSTASTISGLTTLALTGNLLAGGATNNTGFVQVNATGVTPGQITGYAASTYIFGLGRGGTSGNGLDIEGFTDIGFKVNGGSTIGAGTRKVNISISGLEINGGTSGKVTLNVPAAAGSNTLTFPAGTTDFSATGGASRVVKQTTAGGALTVAQLATSDLSDIGTFNLNTSGTIAGASLAVNGALPAAAANTLIVGGVASNPTFGADGEGAAYLGASNGLLLAGRGSTNDLLLLNKSLAIALRIPTGTTNLVGAGTLTGLTGLTSSGTITLSGVTTGTNADFACFAAGGVMTLQTSACTISSLRFKNLIGDRPAGDALADVLKLQPIAFTMKPGEVPNPDWNYDQPQIGLSAENVAAVNPRCAVYEQDGKTPKSYRQECVIAELVGAVRALKADNDSLRAEFLARATP